MTPPTRYSEAGVLSACISLTIAHGRPPTLVELAEHLGMSGGRQALWWTQRLQRQGVLYRDRRIAFAPHALLGCALCILDQTNPDLVAAELLPEGTTHG